MQMTLLSRGRCVQT